MRSSLVDMDLQVLAKEIGHVRLALALHSGPGSYAKTAGYGGHCMRVQVHRRKRLMGAHLIAVNDERQDAQPRA